MVRFFKAIFPFKHLFIEFPRSTCVTLFSPAPIPLADSEEIVNLIRRQTNKSTDLMTISEFVYKIIASSPSYFCCNFNALW